MEILETDNFFTDSPDAGDNDCVCSRCCLLIRENEIPVRCFLQKQNLPGEFRFCENCFNKANRPVKERLYTSKEMNDARADAYNEGKECGWHLKKIVNKKSKWQKLKRYLTLILK